MEETKQFHTETKNMSKSKISLEFENLNFWLISNMLVFCCWNFQKATLRLLLLWRARILEPLLGQTLQQNRLDVQRQSLRGGKVQGGTWPRCQDLPSIFSSHFCGNIKSLPVMFLNSISQKRGTRFLRWWQENQIPIHSPKVYPGAWDHHCAAGLGFRCIFPGAGGTQCGPCCWEKKPGMSPLLWRILKEFPSTNVFSVGCRLNAHTHVQISPTHLSFS